MIVAEDDLDLDYGDADPENPEAEEARASKDRSKERTGVDYPTIPRGFESWNAYFVDVKLKDAARKVSATTIAPYVTASSVAGEIPAAVKKLVDAARKIGWAVNARSFTLHHPEEFYAGDSKVTGASAGDSKTPARDIEHLGVVASHPEARIGFCAEWIIGTTPKGAKSAKFVEALVADAVGIPRELWYEYRIDKTYAKTMGWSEIAVIEMTHRLQSTYNEAADYLAKTLVMKSTPFNEWFEDWLRAISPEDAPKPRAPRKKQSDATAEDLLEKGTWNG